LLEVLTLFLLLFLLIFVFFKSSFTKNAAIRAINQPTQNDINPHHRFTYSIEVVTPKVNGILSSDPHTKINPQPIDSLIGNIISAHNEFPTPMIGSTPIPKRQSAIFK
jgi:hypothetical protein